jgi:hypothetical protein
MASNPFLRMKALKFLQAKSDEEIHSVGPLAALKAKEQAAMRVPLTTEGGIKESQTKKLRKLIKLV